MISVRKTLSNNLYHLGIPTINNDYEDFKILFSIWKEVTGEAADIRLDFSECDFLRPNAVILLGGIARYLETQGRKAYFDWKTLNKTVYHILNKNCFLSLFGDHANSDEHAIPYREDKVKNPDEIMQYLDNKWLGLGWLHISNELKHYINSAIWEIYENAFTHSNSKIGVFTCGQHYTTSKELVLDVADFGCGIPTNVLEYLKRHQNPPMEPKECLKWAFMSGTTTCETSIPRGIGLDILKKFVTINSGCMEIYSDKGYAKIDKDGEQYYNHEHFCQGTFINITLKCDENLYKMSYE